MCKTAPGSRWELFCCGLNVPRRLSVMTREIPDPYESFGAPMNCRRRLATPSAPETFMRKGKVGKRVIRHSNAVGSEGTRQWRLPTLPTGPHFRGKLHQNHPTSPVLTPALTRSDIPGCRGRWRPDQLVPRVVRSAGYKRFSFSATVAPTRPPSPSGRAWPAHQAGPRSTGGWPKENDHDSF
jgi:hypothetical protein